MGIRGKKTAVEVAHISKKFLFCLRIFRALCTPSYLYYISAFRKCNPWSHRPVSFGFVSLDLIIMFYWATDSCAKIYFLIWQLWPQISTHSQGCITDLYANCWPPPVGHSQTDSNTSTGHWKQHMETFYWKILNKSSRETGHGILWPSFLLILQ